MLISGNKIGRTKTFSLIVVMIFLVLTGCTSLKEVNKFASTSATSLSDVNAVRYTFTDYCQHDCELRQMRSGEIDTLYSCNCTASSTKADEAIKKIHTTVTAYLQAIVQLSDNKSFSYDVSNLTASLQQNPLLHLSDEQVSTYNKAGNFIATASTAFYRKKKLKEYISRADSVFQNLTETFIYLIDNRVREQLKIDFHTRLANANQLLQNAKDDKGLRQLVVKMFVDEKNYYQKNVEIINSYTALLRSAQKGHHELYVQRNNFKDIKTKDLLKRYAQEAKEIVANLLK